MEEELDHNKGSAPKPSPKEGNSGGSMKPLVSPCTNSGVMAAPDPNWERSPPFTPSRRKSLELSQ